MLTDPEVGTERADPARSRDGLIAVYGTDTACTARRGFRVHRHGAAGRAYRDRRVFLAGDAAHVHSPVGGQGLNTGVQDAVNLGWKLAQVVKKTSPDNLLDTYHAERHPVGARVLRNTMAQVALCARTPHRGVARHVAELLTMDEPRKRFGALMSGLDIRYDLGDGHPLLGRRMPDLDLVTADGPRRSSRCCTVRGRCCSTSASRAGSTSRRGRIACSRSTPGTRAWKLPAIGVVAAPTAVLIRPDGHVAWVGEGTHPGLAHALTTWFGPPATT